MWNDWSESAVDDDFKRLSAYGVKYLRVFPNWRDFQPIHPLMAGGMSVKEYRLHDAELPKNPYYIDETMAERFGIFCDLAEKHGMKLIVGLLTGWMSGRNFLITADKGAEVLAADENGMPVFTKHSYGKGKVYYLNFPLENNTIGVFDAFEGDRYEVYNEIFAETKAKFALRCDNKKIGITRHGDEYVVMINYSDETQKTNAVVASGYECEVVKGSLDEIAPCEMTILKLIKK